MEDKLTDSMKEIIQKFIAKEKSDISFYVADFADILYKAKHWKKELPRVKIFFALKSNNDPLLLKFLVNIGCGFDCASKGEIEMVLSAGASPSDIIFAHPVKPRSYIHYAASVHVDLMTFDSEHELTKIKDIYPSARLVIRIKTPDVPCSHSFSDKFGCDMEEVRHVLQLAWTLKLNVVGVSFHVGSLCEQPDAYATAIRMSREVFDIAGDVGFSFKLLDIGGGFPGASRSLPHFDKIAFYINQGLEECFPKGCGIEVIAEPGHYVVGSAYLLCTKIIGRKIPTIKDSGHNDGMQRRKFIYYTNDALSMSFKLKRRSGNQMAPLLSRIQEAVPFKLLGVTCMNGDCITEGHAPEMERGEHLVFINMGAYSFCMGSTRFNGFPLPNIYHVFSEHSWYEEPGVLPLEDFLKDLNTEQLKAFQEIRESIRSENTKQNEIDTLTSVLSTH